MKFIIIDDEKSTLNSFLEKFLFDEVDLEAQCFIANPLKSLIYVATRKVDAAFINVNIKQVNGLELAERLLTVDENLKLIFLCDNTDDEDLFRKRFGKNYQGICLKPLNEDSLRAKINELTKDYKHIIIKCFGVFNVFVNGEVLKFRTQKCKELFAILVNSYGGTVTMGNIISILWEDVGEIKAKLRYKDNIYLLNRSLKKYGLEGMVDFGRAQLSLRKSDIQCDYWQYVDEERAYIQESIWSVILGASLHRIIWTILERHGDRRKQNNAYILKHLSNLLLCFDSR